MFKFSSDFIFSVLDFVYVLPTANVNTITTILLFFRPLVKYPVMEKKLGSTIDSPNLEALCRTTGLIITTINMTL